MYSSAHSEDIQIRLLYDVYQGQICHSYGYINTVKTEKLLHMVLSL